MQLPATCDYLIVGAGSAGCVLANRLSANAEVDVVLVEAGPPDDSWLIRTPAAVGALIKHPRYNWNFQTVPQTHLAGRRIPMPRGKVLGGTSSINGMVYIRGHASDYTEWERAGGQGWGYPDLLPYFLRSERNEAWPSSAFHSTAGPMNVTSIRPHNPLVDRFLEAACSLDFPACEDFNAASMDGFGPRQATIRGGLRESMATAFLRPVRHRRNLTVLTDCFVRRIVIEEGRSAGVELEREGSVHRVGARIETILSAGSFGSPAILMHSGIGNEQFLRTLGIKVHRHAPEVGENLQDHLATSILMRTNSPESYGLSWRTLPRAFGTVAEYLLLRRGPLASNVFEAHGFVRSDPGLTLPDLQIIFMPAFRNPSGFPIPLGHGYGINVALLAPRSRGRVMLTGPDPRAQPSIDPNFLGESSDLPPLVHGLKLARRLLYAPAFAPFKSHEVAPGPQAQDDAALEEHVRSSCGTVFHPVGTCRMGGDEMSVVDAQLRVRGIQGLRVVDASVFPRQIRGNTNAPVVMVAEKAADMILGRSPPPPVDPRAAGV